MKQSASFLRCLLLIASLGLSIFARNDINSAALLSDLQAWIVRDATASRVFPSLINATTDDLTSGLRTGLFTSVDLVKAYISRVREVNNTLRAVTQLNPEAIAIAQQLDNERQSGKVRGPLHGIPILIKNNIATKDKLANTAGSYALVGAKVPRDSTVAAKLRNAGAIILGKANLSQWANFRSFNTSDGWSATGGQTEGAYLQNQNPQGSSSGSGVSASIGLALSALGTETDGSIIAPAGANNIVGIKPTVGLTSRDLVVPISEHQDSVGPLARTVKDAAYLLQAIVGRSKFDNYTNAIPFAEGRFPDYAAACQSGALRGKRIGIPRNIFAIPTDSPNFPEVRAFNAVLPLLTAAGATIIDNTDFPGFDLDVASNASINVLEADFVSDLAKYLNNLSTNALKLFTLSDVRRYTTQIVPRQEEFPARDVGIWNDALALGYNNTSRQFWSQYQTNLRNVGTLGITGSLKNHTLDALIAPTTFASHFPALLGSPVISVPLGFYPDQTPVVKNGFGNLVAIGPGYPFGISFFAGKFSEELLIGLAYDYEQKSKIRQKGRQPIIQPKTEVMIRK